MIRKIAVAIGKAHKAGLVHRDLKPANILVMEQDGEAVPKIVDFGIAKGLDQPLAALLPPFLYLSEAARRDDKARAAIIKARSSAAASMPGSLQSAASTIAASSACLKSSSLSA